MDEVNQAKSSAKRNDAQLYTNNVEDYVFFHRKMKIDLGFYASQSPRQ